MSGFDLVPVDGGGPVHLPPGETLLGRGLFLGISDKRVSRHHGLLQNLNGELRLKPTHLNPCFVQSSPTDDPQPLERGSWHVLHHGDFFSLLPGRFIYKVVSVGGDEQTPRNSQMFEEEEEEALRVPPQPALVPASAARLNREETSEKEEEEEEEERCLKQRDSTGSAKDDQRAAAVPLARKRVLPAWMLAAVPAAKGPSFTLKVQSNRPTAPSPAVKRAAVTQATPKATSSPEEAELSEEEEKRPRKKRRKMDGDEEKPQGVLPADPATQHPSKSSRSEGSSHSDSFPMEVEAEGKGNASAWMSENRESENQDEKSENNQPSKRAEPVGSNGGSTSGPAPPKARVRTPCPYGKDCYRKNPLHFQECSHPGDTDYEEEEEEEEEAADKPECPYGTDCYRKNPLHRKEYKHTKKPARTTRHVAKRAPDDEEDEDEYEDSFINDDSEDVGDDLDYVPPDSGDSDKEDIKGLQKEAKAFLKRRK